MLTRTAYLPKCHTPRTVFDRRCWPGHKQGTEGEDTADKHLASCTSWEFIIFWKSIIFQNFWAMSFKNHWSTSYQNIYSNISFPKAVNKTCPCGVTIFTSHHKVITSSRLLQGYYIKVYQGYYVTVTLTNHRLFSKSAYFRCEKNAFLLIGESWE